MSEAYKRGPVIAFVLKGAPKVSIWIRHPLMPHKSFTTFPPSLFHNELSLGLHLETVYECTEALVELPYA